LKESVNPVIERGAGHARFAGLEAVLDKAGSRVPAIGPEAWSEADFQFGRNRRRADA